jgi:hypothetical protein
VRDINRVIAESILPEDFYKNTCDKKG